MHSRLLFGNAPRYARPALHFSLSVFVWPQTQTRVQSSMSILEKGSGSIFSLIPLAFNVKCVTKYPKNAPSNSSNEMLNDH